MAAAIKTLQEVYNNDVHAFVDDAFKTDPRDRFLVECPGMRDAKLFYVRTFLHFAGVLASKASKKGFNVYKTIDAAAALKNIDIAFYGFDGVIIAGQPLSCNQIFRNFLLKTEINA